MSIHRKNPEADLRKQYQVYLQSGLIAVLVTLIVLFRAPLSQGEMADFTPPEQEIVEVEEIIQTEQVETPPPPLTDRKSVV